MKLLPYDTFSFQTALTMDEIVKRMENNIEPKKLFKFLGGEKIFQGSFSESGFQISRRIKYNNSFLPVIKGCFSQKQNRIDVNIKMTLHPIVTFFMFIWFSGVGLALVATTKNFNFIHLRSNISELMPIGMFLFGWILMTACFWPEARKAKKQLFEIFEQI